LMNSGIAAPGILKWWNEGGEGEMESLDAQLAKILSFHHSVVKYW